MAHTSRQLEAFARRKQIPLLSVHCGPKRETYLNGSVTVVEFKRGPFAFGLDASLECDPFLMRYAGLVAKALKNFGAEVIHITGPGDTGCLGAYLAWRLKVPLVISWHTSLHEYAEQRARRFLKPLGPKLSAWGSRLAGNLSLNFLHWFYRKGELLFAPNQEICEELRFETERPVYLMDRGVDTELFTPSRRGRPAGPFRIGYVGRLTAEKNVRFLAECAGSLLAAGHKDFEIDFIGQGRDSDWLRDNVPNARMRGVLLGEELARAYAEMDLFAFPSRTDTFGNVVLEALGSGVPALVRDEGGPKFLVKDRETGFVARSNNEFIEDLRYAYEHRDDLARMSRAAREYACTKSWDTVFQKVFEGYRGCIGQTVRQTAAKRVARVVS